METLCFCWVFVPVVCTRVFIFYYPYPPIFIHMSHFICSRYFQQLPYLFTAFTFLSYFLFVSWWASGWVGGLIVFGLVNYS